MLTKGAVARPEDAMALPEEKLLATELEHTQQVMENRQHTIASGRALARGKTKRRGPAS